MRSPVNGRGTGAVGYSTVSFSRFRLMERSSACSAAGAVLLLLSPGAGVPAFAEDSAASETAVLEEILVTATRRTESVEDDYAF